MTSQDDANAKKDRRILLYEALGDFDGIIARAAFLNDDFQVRVILINEALKGFIQVGSLIIGGRYDRNFGRFVHSARKIETVDVNPIAWQACSRL